MYVVVRKYLFPEVRVHCTRTVHVQYFRTTLLKPLLKIESEASLSPPPAAGVHTEHRVAYKVLC